MKSVLKLRLFLHNYKAHDTQNSKSQQLEHSAGSKEIWDFPFFNEPPLKSIHLLYTRSRARVFSRLQEQMCDAYKNVNMREGVKGLFCNSTH